MLKNGKSKLPYEKLTMEYLFATTKVPAKEDYYSMLSDTHIDNATYDDIKKFWKLFNCKDLAHYSSYYVSSKQSFNYQLSWVYFLCRIISHL